MWYERICARVWTAFVLLSTGHRFTNDWYEYGLIDEIALTVSDIVLFLPLRIVNSLTESSQARPTPAVQARHRPVVYPRPKTRGVINDAGRVCGQLNL